MEAPTLRAGYSWQQGYGSLGKIKPRGQWINVGSYWRINATAGTVFKSDTAQRQTIFGIDLGKLIFAKMKGNHSQM